MKKTQAFDNFDEFAQDYRSIHNENIKVSGADSDYFSEYKIKEILRLEGPNWRPTSALDLGCGDGNSVRFMARHLPGIQVLGIDVSQESITEAQKRQIPGATFQAYDGGNIPAADASFDFCLIATVLHHIAHDRHQALMQEVYRVLKPGGRVYIFEHNPYNPVTRHIVNTCVFDQDAVLLTPGWSKKITHEAGFRQVKNVFTLFFPRSEVFKPFLGLEPWLSSIPLGGQYVTRGVK